MTSHLEVEAGRAPGRGELAHEAWLSHPEQGFGKGERGCIPLLGML